MAAEVAKGAHLNSDYPSFSEIPPMPNDVRPLRMWGRDAQATEQARLDLERNTAPDTWTLKDTGAFAAKAQTDAGPAIAPPSRFETEGFAEDLRKRATPPPPPVR